jgi:hypothetical protein
MLDSYRMTMRLFWFKINNKVKKINNNTNLNHITSQPKSNSQTNDTPLTPPQVIV